MSLRPWAWLLFTDVSQKYHLDLRELNKFTRQKTERDQRNILAACSDQGTKHTGICCNDEGEAQGEIQGKQVSN